MKNKFNGAHFETEKGFRVSKKEFEALKLRLPDLGFAFSKRCHITDFVIPTKGSVTRRMRIETTGEGDDAATRCIRGFKNHPLKGKKGKHVRLEDEKIVKPSVAITFITSAMERLKAPIPYYRKKRLLYQGKHDGFDFVIALDRAKEIGKFSGYYVEIETLLPLGSTEDDVEKALVVIEALAETLFGEKRKPKISYRRMLKKAWKRKKQKKVKKKAKRKARRRELKRHMTAYARLIHKVAPKQKARKKSETDKPKDATE